MKAFKALKSGWNRSGQAWKGVIILWFISLALFSVLALPMKSVMKAGLGDSTITEKLLSGLDPEVMGDLGGYFSSLTHFFTSGLLIVFLIWFILNSFISGGLFNSVRRNANKFSTGEFFKSSASNFGSFLLISFLTELILIVFFALLIGIPVGNIGSGDNPDESVQWIVLFICTGVFIFLLQILMLVTDYARAWQVLNNRSACFRALGFGFVSTFRRFLSSFPMMFLIWAINMLFLVFVFRTIGSLKPVTGIGVAGLFILSQAMFIIRLYFKLWRYASVTSLMELHAPDYKKEEGQITVSGQPEQLTDII
jgi:hypothetical protein